MITVPGSWKSLDDLEESVTLDELIDILTKNRELRHLDRKFEAELHGKTLGDDENGGDPSDPYQRALARAQERLKEEAEEQGNSTEGYGEDSDSALIALGISVTKE